ncbi:MAG TPA: hypothetical protein VKA69_01285 [Desulfobacteria bacterium]|nr:hypothetical protein [Desulfobacteria bacterium]
MKFKTVIRLLVDFFNSHQMDHALIGGFALKAYGYLRATQDVDFILRRAEQSKVIDFLEALGFETLYRSTGYSNHRHALAGLGQIDFVYVAGKTATTIFSQSQRISILKNVELPVVRPIHLVTLKVFAMKNDPHRRLREMADIEFLMTLPEIKTEEVKACFERHGLLKDFKEIIKGKSNYGTD